MLRIDIDTISGCEFKNFRKRGDFELMSWYHGYFKRNELKSCRVGKNNNLI